MRTQDNTLLSVKDLSLDRGDRLLLEGVSFDVQKGDALIIRGPNGLGKTSLMRVLSGLQKQITGTIETSEGGFIYCGHDNALKGQLTISENLQFWRAVFGSNVNVETALAAFDLIDLADRPAHYLSAGQKRRAGLARIIMADKPLWILDEPTVSLDTRSVRLFATAVEAHLAKGGAAIMATHIDLGVGSARILDLHKFQATSGHPRGGFNDSFDEAFL